MSVYIDLLKKKDDIEEQLRDLAKRLKETNAEIDNELESVNHSDDSDDDSVDELYDEDDTSEELDDDEAEAKREYNDAAGYTESDREEESMRNYENELAKEEAADLASGDSDEYVDYVAESEMYLDWLIGNMSPDGPPEPFSKCAECGHDIVEVCVVILRDAQTTTVRHMHKAHSERYLSNGEERVNIENLTAKCPFCDCSEPG